MLRKVVEEAAEKKEEKFPGERKNLVENSEVESLLDIYENL